MSEQTSFKCPCGLWFYTKADLEKHYKKMHVEVTYNLKTGRFYVIKKRVAIKGLLKK